MPPTLELAFTLRALFSKDHMLDVKSVKGGPQRTIAPIVSGHMKGSGLEAEVIPAGGDWLLINPEDNTAHLDVRLGLRSLEGGHSIYLRYEGVLRVDAKSFPQLTGGSNAKSTEFGEHEWFTSPIFETSDPDFKWMENSSFVGEGRWVVEDGEIGIEYQIHRLRPSR